MMTCTIWPFCLWQWKEGQSYPLCCVVNKDLTFPHKNKNSTSFIKAGLTLIWTSRFNVWHTKLTGQSTLLRLISLTNDQLKSVMLPKTPSCKCEQSTHCKINHWSTWDSVWMCCWEETCITGQKKTSYLSHLEKHYQCTWRHYFCFVLTLLSTFL